MLSAYRQIISVVFIRSKVYMGREDEFGGQKILLPIQLTIRFLLAISMGTNLFVAILAKSGSI